MLRRANDQKPKKVEDAKSFQTRGALKEKDQQRGKPYEKPKHDGGTEFTVLRPKASRESLETADAVYRGTGKKPEKAGGAKGYIAR